MSLLSSFPGTLPSSVTQPSLSLPNSSSSAPLLPPIGTIPPPSTTTTTTTTIFPSTASSSISTSLSNPSHSSLYTHTSLPENTFTYRHLLFTVLESYATIRLSVPIPKKLLDKQRGAKYEDILTTEYRIGMATRTTAEVTHYGVSHPARTIALSKKQSAMVYPTGLIVVRGRRGITESMLKDSCRLAAQIVQRATNLVTTPTEPIMEGLVLSVTVPMIKNQMDTDVLYFERLSTRYPEYIIYEPELLHALIIRIPSSKHIPTGMLHNHHQHSSSSPSIPTSSSRSLSSTHTGNPVGSSVSSTTVNKNAILTLLPDGRICLHNILTRLSGIIAYEWFLSRLIQDNYEQGNRILTHGWSEIVKYTNGTNNNSGTVNNGSSSNSSTNGITLEGLGLLNPQEQIQQQYKQQHENNNDDDDDNNNKRYDESVSSRVPPRTNMELSSNDPLFSLFGGGNHTAATTLPTRTMNPPLSMSRGGGGEGYTQNTTSSPEKDEEEEEEDDDDDDDGESEDQEEEHHSKRTKLA